MMFLTHRRLLDSPWWQCYSFKFNNLIRSALENESNVSVAVSNRLWDGRCDLFECKCHSQV